MKRNYLYMICFLILFSCESKIEKAENTTIFFDNSVFDFGEIPAKIDVAATFQFTNTGDKPLYIKEVKTSCGCAVPKWSKEIITPNEKGELIVIYDAKSPGAFRRNILVFYNGKNSPKEIFIKGEVDYLELFK